MPGIYTTKWVALAVVALVFLVGCGQESTTTPGVPGPPKFGKLPDFSSYADVAEKKDAFFDYLEPQVRYANDQVWLDRVRVEALRSQAAAGPLAAADATWLTDLSTRYGVALGEALDDNHFDRLLRRVDVVPASLVLAQAANESAWGTSRFARQANNLFGIWCYKPGCGLKPAKRNTGAKHEVRAYKTPFEGINGYVHNINTGHAYEHLREIRAEHRANEAKPTGLHLVVGLTRYSERGEDYVEEIARMIRQNKLAAFLVDRAAQED